MGILMPFCNSLQMLTQAQLDYCNNCTSASNACCTIGTIVLQSKTDRDILPTRTSLTWYSTGTVILRTEVIPPICPLLAKTGAAMVYHNCSHPA
ncbi:unnamed protein product [Nezara viridula]|uniref:Uncharacterized protein n=1 Tax=Nezara viridula TaxID=85310 RepID=A0A9P0H4F3_NEZVI|nr:unnamed protein product [Nezara viridula]